jgi:hypothetical protein
VIGGDSGICFKDFLSVPPWSVHVQGEAEVLCMGPSFRPGVTLIHIRKQG